ncbi:MAG: tetratricopeptide repeat protein [Janthinobacterium lividum]
MNPARSFRRFAPIVIVFSMLSARPAHAVSKEMIELQTQVQQLTDSVARLQQSNDQQMGVLKDLVQQTVDSVNKMSVNVNGMQLKLQNQGDAQATRNDQLSGQVQALNDSLDELKARMLRMEKSLNDIQNQAQTNAGSLGALPGAGSNGGGASAPPSSNTPPAAPPLGPNNPGPGAAANRSDSGPGAPAVGEMYRTAYSDYMAGKYPLATSEFTDLIKAYPEDNLAGNAYFYIGEMNVRGSKPAAAVKNYDQVLERYPDNAKIPAAHLHKGEALIALKETEAGTRELRALVQRFPNSPEAAQARTRLNAASARR